MANYRLTNSDKFYIEQHPDINSEKLAKLLGCHPTTILKYRRKINKKNEENEDSRQVEEPQPETTAPKVGPVDQFKKNGETQAVGMSRAAGEMIDDIIKNVNTEPDPSYTKRFKPKI